MDAVIRNGTITTAYETTVADLGIQDGRVVCIGHDLDAGTATVFEADGKRVLPGAIDAHVHFHLPVGNLFSADDCASGTRAAACGGVTTVLDFATPDPGQPLGEAVRKRIAEFAASAHVDFGLHAVIRGTGPDLAVQMRQALDQGVSSFKAYLVYAGLMLDDGDLSDALAVARDTGALLSVHAENASLIDHRIRQLQASGLTTPWHHYESRPEFVEAEAVRRVLDLARAMDAPVYIVHLACEEGLEAVSRARSEGQPVYAETCPHYLHFTKEVYRRGDGHLYICSPAIKGAESREALWSGIRRGVIQVVATDHCPFQSNEKALGADDFTKIPNGCMGVETLYPFMLDAACRGMIPFSQAVAVCSANPARLFGCAPQKGTLAIGSDADLVIFDPNGSTLVTRAGMHSKVDYTIWEGIRLQGRIEQVFSRGRLVCHDGQALSEPGWGRYVPCQPVHGRTSALI